MLSSVPATLESDTVDKLLRWKICYSWQHVLQSYNFSNFAAWAEAIVLRGKPCMHYDRESLHVVIIGIRVGVGLRQQDYG